MQITKLCEVWHYSNCFLPQLRTSSSSLQKHYLAILFDTKGLHIKEKNKKVKNEESCYTIEKRGCRTLKNTILNHNQPHKLRKTQWKQHQAPQNWLQFLTILVLFPKPILDLFLNLIWIWFTQVWITNYATKDNNGGTD